MKKLTYILVIFTLIFFVGLNYIYSPLMTIPTDNINGGEDKYLNIMTVNKSQYEMVKALTKDKHSIEYLAENENEVNSFKVNDDIVKNISNMDLLIYNGLGYEKWIYELINKSKSQSLGIINLSKGIRPLLKELSNNRQENPYYLFGLNEYKIALYNIKIALQEKDIKNREYYEGSYNEKVKEIEELYKKAKEEISKYNNSTAVVDSDKLDYLFRDLNIKTIKVNENNSDESFFDDLKSKEKIIYFHDKKEDKIDINKFKVENFKYIELETEMSDQALKNNIKLIIETIKNN